MTGGALPEQVGALLALTGQRIPVVQAPIGSAATPALVGAVTRAGGMGGLAMTWSDPAAAVAKVRATREATGGAAFFANFVLHFPCEGFGAALDAGVPIVTLSWGLNAGMVARAHRAGAKVGIQVGNADGARRAREAGADFLIAQGVEAGGHVQSTTPLATLLPAVLAEAGGLPVIAAGGIADGRGIAAVMMLGAAAVQIGTAFLACDESGAPAIHRDALFKYTPTDTALTRAFSGRLVRAIRNRLFDELDAHAGELAPFPIQNWLSGTLRAAAIQQGRAEFLSLQAGQAGAPLRYRSTAFLMIALMRQTEAAVAGLRA